MVKPRASSLFLLLLLLFSLNLWLRVPLPSVYAESIFSDGFESGDTSQWTGTSTSSGCTFEVQSTTVKTGSYSSNSTIDTDQWGIAYAYKNITELTDTVYMQAWIRVENGWAAASNQLNFLRAVDASADDHLMTVGWTNRSLDNTLWWSFKVFNGSSYYLSHDKTVAPSLDTWFNVTMYGKFGDLGTGDCKLWVDGTLLEDVDNIDTNNNVTGVDQFFVGITSSLAAGDQVAQSVYTDGAEISSSLFGQTPTIGEFSVSDSRVGIGEYFTINATVQDLDGSADVKNVTLDLGNSVILQWVRSTDTFSENTDTNSYCTLAAASSSSSNPNSTSWALQWNLTLAIVDQWSIVSTNTWVYDSLSYGSQGSSSNLFITDAIMVSLSIADDRHNVGANINVNANITYAYDKASVTDGTVQLNGTNMAYQAGNWWQLAVSQSTVGQQDYVVDSVTGNTYGITTMGKIDFDGTDDTVTVSDDASLQLETTITISAWVNVDADADGTYHILTSKAFAPAFGIHQSNKVLYWFDSGSDLMYSNTAISSGIWTHIVGVHTNSTTNGVLFYIDGSLVSGTVYSSKTLSATSDDLVIGNGGSHDFGGSIGDIRYYNRSLSATEIYELYQGRYSNTTGLVLHLDQSSLDVDNAQWTDLSGEGNDGTVTGATIQAGASTDEVVKPIWDAIMVSLQIDDDRENVGSATRISANITRAYDKASFTSSDGTVQINGTSATWTSGNGWYADMTKTTVGQWDYVVDSVTDNTYGVTTLGKVDFDGSNDYVSFTEEADISHATDHSIEGWFNSDSISTTQTLLHGGIDSNDRYCARIFGSKLSISFYNGSLTIHARETDNALSSDTWYHFLYVHESDGTTALYLNGVAQTDTSGNPSWSGDTEYIGARGDLGTPFSGMIGDTRLWNVTFTAAQSLEHYYGYYSSTTGLILHYDQSSWDHTNTQWDDLSGEGNDGTVTGCTVQAGASTDEYTKPIWDAIMVSLQLDDDEVFVGDDITVYANVTRAFDKATFDNTGSNVVTLNGTAMTWSAGNNSWYQTVQQATYGTQVYVVDGITDNTYGITTMGKIDFDGSNDHIAVSDSSTLDVTSTLTVACWLNGGTQTNKYMLTKWDYGADERSWSIASHSGDVIVAISDDGTWDATHRKSYTTSGTLFDSTWKHFAFTFNAGTLTIYINGVEDTSVTKGIDEAITTIHSGSADVELGCRLNSGTPADFYDGLLTELRIYNRTLSATEIYELYQGRYSNDNNLALHLDQSSWDHANTQWDDLSGNSNDGTVSGATVQAGASTDEYNSPYWDSISITLQARDNGAVNSLPRTVTYKVTNVNSSVTTLTSNSAGQAANVVFTQNGTATIVTWWGNYIIDTTESITVAGTADASTSNIDTVVERLTDGSYYLLTAVNSTAMSDLVPIGSNDWECPTFTGSGTQYFIQDSANWKLTEPKSFTISGIARDSASTGWSYTASTNAFEYPLAFGDLGGETNLALSFDEGSPAGGGGGGGGGGYPAPPPGVEVPTAPTLPDILPDGTGGFIWDTQLLGALAIGAVVVAVVGGKELQKTLFPTHRRAKAIQHRATTRKSTTFKASKKSQKRAPRQTDKRKKRREQSGYRQTDKRKKRREHSGYYSPDT